MRTIDLFAGAGGMTEGFRAAGFRSVFANDHERPALDTFRRNHPEAETSSQSIEELDAEAIRRKLGLRQGELEVLLGGPPCQGFSTYGKRDPSDRRNQLYLHYLRFLEAFRPQAFVIENVVGILSIEGGSVIADIQEKLGKLGYGVVVVTLDAAEYGVPQFRKRVFVYGGAARGVIRNPERTHGMEVQTRRTLWGEELLPAVTVRAAIGDLPTKVFPPRATQQAMPYPEPGPLSGYQRRMRAGASHLLHHSAKQMLGIRRLRLALMRPGDYGTKIRTRIQEQGLSDELIEELLSGGEGLRDLEECRTEDRAKERELRRLLQVGRINIDEVLQRLDSGGFANKYRRLDWDRPSHTLVAHMARDCSDFVHPEVDRFVSVREAARLQSFPDRYCFCGSQFQQFRQIGNAVAPALAQAVAEAIREFLGRRGATRLIGSS